jgi:hypothetical protein
LLRFFIGVRLAISCDLLFLRWLLVGHNQSTVLHVQLRRNLHTAFESSCYGAKINMHLVRPLGGLPVLGGQFQMVVRVDPLDDQDLAVLFDFSPSVADQPAVASRDFARFQRAAERAGQSPGSGRHQVVEGGGVGFVNVGVNPVVLGDLRMNAENHRLRHLGQIGATQRALDTLDLDTGCVRHFIRHAGTSLAWGGCKDAH